MKINPCKWRVVFAATAVAFGLFSQPVFSQNHQFVITENSSSLLSVTYDGSPLTVISNVSGTDTWSFALPPGFLSVPLAGSWQWTETDNLSLVNLVNFGSNITRAGFIQSDVPQSTAFPTLGDGASVQVGVDGGTPVFAAFYDRGDVAAVPDGGTTCSLLALSLTGLALVRRRVSGWTR